MFNFLKGINSEKTRSSNSNELNKGGVKMSFHDINPEKTEKIPG